jgi:hypothetical protein
VIERTSQKQTAKKTITMTRTIGRKVLRIRRASLVRGDIEIDYEGMSPKLKTGKFRHPAERLAQS